MDRVLAMTHEVSVINRSTILSDDRARLLMDALEVQVDQHFTPVWGIEVGLNFVPSTDEPVAGEFWLVLLDGVDQAFQLGYYDLTNEGLPMGKVFIPGLSSVEASRELLSMLVDPYLTLTVQLADGKTFYAYEICDAVGSGGYAYHVHVGEEAVAVSDFVYPRWFDETATEGEAQFDHCNHLDEPLQGLPGGYVTAWTAETGWQTRQAGPPAPGDRPAVGSRRERRRTPKTQWLRSEPRPVPIVTGQ